MGGTTDADVTFVQQASFCTVHLLSVCIIRAGGHIPARQIHTGCLAGPVRRVCLGRRGVWLRESSKGLVKSFGGPHECDERNVMKEIRGRTSSLAL